MPSFSKCHASDAEWYKLVKAGFERKMFQQVHEDDIFRDHNGAMVLSGAMGVDKPKEINGVVNIFLRFLTFLTP